LNEVVKRFRPSRACGTALVRALVGLLALALPAVVSAQGPPRLPAFRPDVTFGIVFDDNVFMRPEPEGDIFIRLTPGFDLVHESPRLHVNGLFRFDAERYQDRTDLNEAVARQQSSLDLTWRPNNRFGLISRAAYDRTQTPLDLNAATGLAGGRQPAWRMDFSLGFENTIRPRRRVTLGGDYSHYDLEVGVDTTLRAVRVRYTEDLSPRSQMYFNYRFEQREFHPGALLLSHVGVGAWSYRLAPPLLLLLEAGPRVSEGQWSPEVNISVTQTINNITTFSAGYAHTQDVAAGVAGLITIDRVTSSLALRRNNRWELIVTGGGFRNVQPGGDTVAYDASVSVGRSLSDALWLVATASRTSNDIRTRGVTVTDSEIVRNWAMVSIRVQPFRPR
jgi:hypothetical protein